MQSPTDHTYMSDTDFSDDDVFNDTLDNESIESLLSKPTLSLTLKQRNLFGEIVESEYIDIRDQREQTQQQQVIAFPPTHHNIDYNELGTYIYPTNFEVRDYQFNIVRNSFFNNILVALPTGLGKTFIASTVILNFHRWFPNSKIVFMAPTRPLVAQQIKACCGVTGISSSVVATLLDKTKRNRQEIWNEKSVFFTTPQVVENDLLTGILDAKLIVLLVIDEAHRSKGNYAYNNVVKHLYKAGNKSFRILSLTATPASDIEGVQEIISNLNISKVEVRTEQLIDIAKYLKRKKIERYNVTNTDEINECIDLLSNAIEPTLKLANDRHIYDVRDPLKINAFQVLDAQQRITKNPSIPEPLKWLNYFILQLLAIVGQALRRLVIYGVRSFYSYFKNKHTEFITKNNKKQSKNNNAVAFWLNDNIRKLLFKCENEWLKDPIFLGHPKLEIIVSELTTYFSDPSNTSSRCIIFTEFRESALDIVRSLEQQGDSRLKPHIFIGQAKEKEKFDEEKFLNKKKNNKKKSSGTKAKGKDKENNNVEIERTSSEDAQIKGMNQKFQKELISKFKTGEYNVLVATSIGEEGLDIGEVDLIICYDSTGSPIKNIQRMGRTGRKRDGKVILLFASNEEQKFDKAMGGYEYIQQHIMTNKSIELGQSDRIIPKQYTPIVKKVFIEVPDENKELVKQEDEDEILRIATQYMSKKKVSKKKAPPKKIQKQFFIPENVETGFTKATSLVRKVGETRDILDKIFDSLEEEAEEEIKEQEKETEVVAIESEPELVDPEVEINKPMKEDPLDESRKRFAPKFDVEVISKKKSLGVKRFKQIDAEQLKSEPDELIPPETASTLQISSDDDDVFDDGLDFELVKIEKASSVSPFPTSQIPASENSPSQIHHDDINDPIYKHEFDDNEGLLNDAEQERLYTSYYITLDPSDMVIYYDPSEGLVNPVVGEIGHSKRIKKLMEINHNLTKERAVGILEQYKKELHK